jgi:nucleoside-diphosphate-sugar epimerase
MKNGEGKNMYNRILITGGNGFVGKNLVPYLAERSYLPYCPSSFQLDLLNFNRTKEFFKNIKPDCIIHLAATCGGIGANAKASGTFMRNNLTMGLNLINTALDIGCVRKFIMVGTVCSYPCNTPIPFKEENLWNGYPEKTNAGYGISKKTLIELLQAYNKQFGFNSVNLLPANMYGNEDHFNLTTSHIIPAIILKVQDAIDRKSNDIVLWGTGKPTRDFLHVSDFCHAVFLALEKEPGPEPINIGTGKETSIIDVTSKICEIMGFNGKILYDSARPDGQPRRCLDITRGKNKLGYAPQINLYNGLVDTINWFHDNKKSIL